MSMSKEQIFTEAMALNPKDREALAEELLMSVDDADRAAIDAAWLAEARRRDEAYACRDTTALAVSQTIDRICEKGRASCR